MAKHIIDYDSFKDSLISEYELRKKSRSKYKIENVEYDLCTLKNELNTIPCSKDQGYVERLVVWLAERELERMKDTKFPHCIDEKTGTLAKEE